MTAAASSASDPSMRDLPVRLHQQGLVANFGRFALRTNDMQTILDEATRAAASGLDARFAKMLVKVAREGDRLRLAVSDQGRGFPVGFDSTASCGLDLRIVASLAKSSLEEAIAIDRSVRFGRIVVTMRISSID
jgi:two-component sensor histidine kinase